MPDVADARSDERPLLRHDWTRAELAALFALPLPELIFWAQTVRRRFFDPREAQVSTLLSIKTGGCPEDTKLMSLDAALAAARAAKAAGATRFCMGAAWRSPKDHDLDAVCAMIAGVKRLGMESCVTLGMLTADQARRLQGAGLDYDNHNLDTSPEFYGEIMTTRSYEDRLETLGHVRDAGISVCCGGILGMGESVEDRIGMIAVLANLPKHPESAPINMLVQVAGTPLAQLEKIDPLDFVRVIAVARIAMQEMSDETQALCFLAGANSIFAGEKLLTAANPEQERDRRLLVRLGLVAMPI